jgi:hypothetical protein
VLLVHEFVTTETDDEKHAINARVLDDFLRRLNRTPPRRNGVAEAWITEPVTVRGDDKWLPRELPVHVAKLVTEIRVGARTSASPGSK